jgi:hypothetical protein
MLTVKGKVREGYGIASGKNRNSPYYPHPETKPNHFQDQSTMELILPYIPGISYGDDVLVSVNQEEITFSSSIIDLLHNNK